MRDGNSACSIDQLGSKVQHAVGMTVYFACIGESLAA
jgi:hypothetical protein